MNMDLALNWFDFLVILFLLVGAKIGRDRGMSQELFDVLQWIVMVGASALLYQPVGQFIAQYTGLDLLLSYIMSYVFWLVLIKVFFTWIKGLAADRVLKSDCFGAFEYYLGLLAGTVRHACILLVAFSFLNAKFISPEQRAAQINMQQENFGDISLPTIASMQETVFADSTLGRLVKNHLDTQLIAPTPYEGLTSKRTPARQKQRLLNETLDG